MNKKVLILLGGLLLLIAIILGFIFFVKSRQNTNTSTPPIVSTTTTGTSTQSGSSSSSNSSSSTPPSSTSTPTPPASTANQNAQKASDSAVISPVLSYDGQSVWYFTADGHLYTINLLTGLKQEYLLPDQLQVSNVIWPAIGNDFIVETDGNGGKTFAYYNSQQKKFTPYPSNVKEVAFLSDGLHVAYQWDNGDNTTSLSTAKPDLTGHKTILALPDADDVLLPAPVGGKLLAWKSNTPNDGKLYYINLNSSSPKLITLKTAADHQAKWSPDGEHFVYQKMSGTDSSSNILYYGDIVTGTDDSLAINTAVSKVTFDNTGKNIYVGVPGSASSDGDAFWKISASNYQKTQISSATGIDSYDLMASNDGSKLYFVSAKDNYLYFVATTK